MSDTPAPVAPLAPAGTLKLSDDAKHHALASLFNIEPQNITELIAMAKMYANSELVPKDYQRKPQNIVIAITMGRSVGLSSMQSLLSIAVINGRPTIWGDAIPALLYYHGVLDPDFGNGGILERSPDEAWKAREGECQIKRLGWATPLVRRFTYQEAIDAKLIERSKGGAEAKGVGPWITYPGRMLQMRARSWAARDACPDIMKGLWAREEAEDIRDARTGEPVSGIRPPKTIIDVREVEKFTQETASQASPQGSIAAPRVSGAAAAAEGVPSNAKHWMGQITRITQQMVGAKKNVTKYTLHGQNPQGEIQFQTIRKEDMEKAKDFASTGEIAKVTYTYNEQYRNNDFVAISAAEQPPAPEQEEPGSSG